MVAAASAVLSGRPGALTAPDPLFVWWLGAALVLGGLGAALLLNLAPPRAGRAWRPAFVLAVLLLGCYTAVFPAAFALLFFVPEALGAWLAAGVLGLLGAVRLWQGRARGGVYAALPPLLLGACGAAVPPTADRGHGYPTLGGWAGIAAGVVLLLLTAAAGASGRDGRG
jgi:hypothetical protein